MQLVIINNCGKRKYLKQAIPALGGSRYYCNVFQYFSEKEEIS